MTTQGSPASIVASGDAGDPEDLGRGTVREPGDPGRVARPGDDALRDGVRVGHLALVAHEGGHLALHGGGRLHGDAGPRPTTTGAHDPQLRDAPGLEPFVE